MNRYYIYLITNNLNGKTYIGQRKCPVNIEPKEDSYMGSGLLIKRAITKYGLENFKKDILEDNILCKKDCNVREKFWISKYKTDGRCEYNISLGGTGGNLGPEVSKKIHETKLRNREKNLKSYRSSEYISKIKENIIRAHREGKYDNIFTEEVRKKQSESAKKAWVKFGDKFRAIRNSKEYRDKLSIRNKGKVRSEENKKKISESVKKLHREDEEFRLKFLETCKKNSEANKGRKQYTINGVHRWLKKTDVVPENAIEGWV